VSFPTLLTVPCDINHGSVKAVPKKFGHDSCIHLFVQTLTLVGKHMKKLVLAFICSTLTATASASLLIETFEGITGAPAPGGYSTYTAGSTFTTGNGIVWTVGGNSVDLINAAYGSPDGSVGVDLNGNAAGSISTTVATTPGLSTFSLGFQFLSNGLNNQQLFWSVGGVSGDVNAGNTATFINPTWTGIAGSSVVITFSGDPTFTNGGPTIDNIKFTQTPVAAVPVPGALALMIAGLGALGVSAKRRQAR
jgi:hypothetical protein